MKQVISLGFSPCPNDTFIFEALVNKKIDTDGLDFEVHLEDVQKLNEWAKAGKLDVTKISYGALPLVLGEYIVLKSGGALGKGVGPLLIGKEELAYDSHRERNWETIKKQIDHSVIAIPGENTTAHFLFSQAFPEAWNKVFMRFDEIEEFVSQGRGHGVIIHENRFTYRQKGLHKVVDLGEYWEKATGYPIPLGGIVMKKELGDDLHQQVNRLIRQSLEYAFTNYPFITDYVKQHSQEMSEAVMRQHIDLYVNDFSLDLGEDGQAAVRKLLETLAPSQALKGAIFAG